MKYTTDIFINKAKSVHGNRYDYSKVEYKSIKEKVCIVCLEHGEFWQTPDNHLHGQGCPMCGKEKNALLQQNKRSNTEDFIRKSKEIFGDFYDYNKTNYITAKIPVIITCPIHGDFEVVPHSHLARHCGCRKCRYENVRKKHLSNTEQFIIKAKNIHGNVYDYSKVNYIDAHTEVCIICPIHGEFWQTPNKHLNGHNCPKCRRSRGEEIVENILKELNIPFETQVKYKLANRMIWLDFKIVIDSKTYIIEYNGIQHYQPCEYFGGDIEFEKQIARDNDVRNFCLDNKFNLLEIKYTETQDSIKNLIINFIAPINSDINSKSGELLENPKQDNQQPS